MSPTAADKLAPSSTREQKRDAIAECISQMNSEHPDWDNDRLVAACHSMAKQAMSK